MSEAAPDEPAAWIEKFEHRWVAAWNNHDAAALVHLCHPAIEWSDSAARRVLRGRVQVQERIAQTLVMFPDVRFEPVTLYVDPRGAGAAVWWRMYATFLGPMDPPGFAPTGRRVRCDGVDFWRFQDGLVRNVHVLYDVNGIGQQVGLVPAPGSHVERLIVAGQRLATRVAVRLRR
jgi:steroid delta-isomerase-like uncharacterized protein